MPWGRLAVKKEVDGRKLACPRRETFCSRMKKRGIGVREGQRGMAPFGGQNLDFFLFFTFINLKDMVLHL
jgi:hypothetical protein